MFRKTDPLMGAPRGSAAIAIAACKLHGAKGDFETYVNRVYEFAPKIGMDPGWVVAQAIWETSWFTSFFWVRDGNPGGIGIDGDDETTQTNVSPFRKLDGTEAATVHLGALWLKIAGTGETLPVLLAGALLYSKAYLDHVVTMTQDANWPPVTTFQDLNKRFQSTITGYAEATWAWDANYADGVTALANALFPNAPDWSASSNPPASGGGNVSTTLVFGRVPRPAVIERYVTDAENGAWDFLGQKTVKGVVWHRMEGSLNGTDGWFRRGKGVSDGLTEFGIGSANIDGAALDGIIYVWNDVKGVAHDGVSPNRSPWASGPVKQPYGDGLAFLQDNGMDLNVVNRDEAAIEISGDYNDPVSAKAQEAICQLTAYWADQAKIPWDSFPIIPGKGYSFVRWHQEYTIGTGKICPGPVVMDLTPALIARIAQILKQWQVQQVTETTPSTTPSAPAPKPAPTYPFGMNYNRLAFAFGRLKDPKTGKVAMFAEPPGPVGSLWLQHGAKTGRFGRLIDIQAPKDANGVTNHRRWLFSDGLLIEAWDGRPAFIASE